MNVIIGVVGLLLIIISSLGTGKKGILEAEWYWQFIFVAGFLLAVYGSIAMSREEKSKKEKK